MLVPAIIASGMIAFATSLDKFIISNFPFGDASNLTVPLIFYSATRVAPTPALNALATLLLVGTLMVMLLTYVVLNVSRRGSKGSVMEELTGMGN